MPAPAEPPPPLSEFPLALRRHVQKILDYAEATHIEDASVELVGSPPSNVEFTRGETGVIMRIRLAGVGGSITVTAEDASGYSPGSGVESVEGVTILTFDQDVFEIFDGGGGQCVVRLKTETCS